MFGYVQSCEKFLLCRNFSMLCYWNARCGAGVLVLLSVCRLYILAANGSGTNAFTLRGCGIRDTYIDYAN